MPRPKAPELDWDEVLNKFKGLPFAGCKASEHEVQFSFGNGRRYTLSGSGQKHTYEVTGNASGKFEGVDVLSCRGSEENGKFVSRYTALIRTEGGGRKMVASRVTDSRPKDGMRRAVWFLLRKNWR